MHELMIYSGEAKKRIRQIVDDIMYQLNDTKDILQYKALETFINDDINMDKNIEKFLSLTT